VARPNPEKKKREPGRRYGYVATDKSATNVKQFSFQGNLARELTDV
jgi:hypothetical protein